MLGPIHQRPLTRDPPSAFLAQITPENRFPTSSNWQQHTPEQQRHQRPQNHSAERSLVTAPPKQITQQFSLPTRISIHMIRETVYQMQLCRDIVSRSYISRIQDHVRPPAMRLDEHVRQYEQQLRTPGRPTGLAFLEKQIQAADDQIVIALTTEVSLIRTLCEQILDGLKGQNNVEALTADLIEDTKRLDGLYQWLVQTWKTTREQAKVIIPITSASHNQPPLSATRFMSDPAAGAKRKRSVHDDGQAEALQRKAAPPKFADRPAILPQKRVVLDLCSTDDEQPESAVQETFAPASTKSSRRTSTFRYVDLTWAVDKTQPNSRSKSDPGPKTKTSTKPDSTLSRNQHANIPIQVPQTVDAAARKMQDVARNSSQLFAQAFVDHGRSVLPVVPANSNGTVFFGNGGSHQEKHLPPKQLPQTASLPQAMLMAGAIQPQPQQVTQDGPATSEIVQSDHELTNGIQITSSKKQNQAQSIDLASSILRAIGRHPSQPFLNDRFKDLISRKQIRKYNKALKIDGEGLAIAQHATVMEARKWWAARR